MKNEISFDAYDQKVAQFKYLLGARESAEEQGDETERRLHAGN